MPRKLFATGLSLLIVALSLSAAPALAGKVTATTGWSVTHESRSGYPPLDCYHEDSFHARIWSGSLGPGESFQVALPFCSFDQYPSGPGGAGFLMGSSGSGRFSLQARSPSGVDYPAQLVGTKRSTEEWRRCIVQPSFNAAQQVGIGTIEPGLWSVVFTNLGDRLARSVSLQVTVNQAVSSWQEANCPSQDWNFT